MSKIILAAAVLLLVVTPAAPAAPPDNDDHLAATALNGPGSEMPRDTVTSPATDTSEATLQADLLDPPSVGGPPEPSACGQSPLDHTVWFRFFPEVAGSIRLQALGYDATLALVPFSAVASPFPQGYDCANRRDDTIETLNRPVEAGMNYAVQAGGAAGAAGTLQVNRSWAGSIDYSYDSGPRGGVFLYLIVRGAPRGARVEIRCSRGCRRQRLKVRSKVTRVKSFRGRFMPAGARVQVRVTKRGYIGDYRAFTVAGGEVTRTDGCLPPGSTVPRRTCK